MSFKCDASPPDIEIHGYFDFLLNVFSLPPYATIKKHLVCLLV